MHKQGTGYTGQTKSDRGFYIILAICLAVIAISSYILFAAPKETGEANRPNLISAIGNGYCTNTGGSP